MRGTQPTLPQGGSLDGTLVNIAAKGRAIAILASQAVVRAEVMVAVDTVSGVVLAAPATRAEVATALDASSVLFKLAATRPEAAVASDFSDATGGSVPSDNWIVNGGTITFVQGSTTPFNLVTTGPFNYKPGGIYGVDPLGAQLPLGVTLTEAGLLTIGPTTVPGSLAGVFFTYTEPDALATLTIVPTTVAGRLPILATVYPPETVVPAGQTLGSPDESTLVGTVISAWEDGSAQIVVLAGAPDVVASTPETIRLRQVKPSTVPAVLPTRIGAMVTSIAFNFGTVGAGTISNFDNPEFVWWSNERFICARYRVPIGTSAMEGVIDIHAWASPDDRAFVEVVVENSKMDIAASPIPVIPDLSYTGATVDVNGVTLATVNSSGCPNLQIHQKTRAWYCSTWIGPAGVNDFPAPGTGPAGGPQGCLQVTHDKMSMRALPYFWAPAREITTNFEAVPPGSSGNWGNQAYGADKYTPWNTGRQLPTNMGGTGEAARGPIGTLAGWEADYMLTGNKRCHNACIQNALVLLTYNINWRKSTTGLVPNGSDLLNRRQDYTSGGGLVDFPNINQQTGNSNATYDTAHHPANPVVAFMCRPSPCIIEIAQKAMAMHATFGTHVGWTIYSADPRVHAWRMRNYGYGTFLTPNLHPKFFSGVATDHCTSYRALMLRTAANECNVFRDHPKNKLDIMFRYAPWEVQEAPSNDFHDHSTDRPHFNTDVWEHCWITNSYDITSRMKLMRGADQATFDATADWLCKFPVRVTNEPTGGEFRLNTLYSETIGIAYFTNGLEDPGMGEAGTIGRVEFANDWGAARNMDRIDAPPPESGPWLYQNYAKGGNTPNPRWNEWADCGPINVGQNGYETRVWSAICAAKERGIPGADAMWERVYGISGEQTGKVTNMTQWMNGFVGFSLNNRVARNLP